MRKGIVYEENGNIKGTIDEELWDVIYYALAIANCYDIDMEKQIQPLVYSVGRSSHDPGRQSRSEKGSVSLLPVS